MFAGNKIKKAGNMGADAEEKKFALYSFLFSCFLA